MRVALILVAVIGCSKQSAEPRAEEPAAAPSLETALHAPPAPPPAPTGASPMQTESAKAGSAVDEARATGVLGPTDRAAFEVRGKVTLDSAMKAVDEAIRPKLDAVQACYDKVLAFEETLAGKLTLRVDAGELAVVRTTLKHADLEKCVLDVLATATLPKLGKATVTLAFTRE